MSDLHYLTLSALLTWLMLLVASLLRARGWTLPGMRIAFGNRDNVPEATPMTARVERAARNMVENLALFAAVLAAARLGGATSDAAAPGAAIFFWARVAYFATYLAGIAYLRTGIWMVSLVGLVWIGWAGW